jgi:hypothetical protein
MPIGADAEKLDATPQFFKLTEYNTKSQNKLSIKAHLLANLLGKKLMNM